MLGTVHVSIQFFFYRDGNLLVHKEVQVLPFGYLSSSSAGPLAFAFLWCDFRFSLSSILEILITLLVKRICGSAGSDDHQELHLDTCWDMNWQCLQVRFVRG